MVVMEGITDMKGGRVGSKTDWRAVTIARVGSEGIGEVGQAQAGLHHSDHGDDGISSNACGEAVDDACRCATSIPAPGKWLRRRILNSVGIRTRDSLPQRTPQSPVLCMRTCPLEFPMLFPIYCYAWFVFSLYIILLYIKVSDPLFEYSDTDHISLALFGNSLYS